MKLAFKDAGITSYVILYALSEDELESLIKKMQS